MKFYYVYILHSLHHDFIYIGFTEDLKRRFEEHNSKKEFSTKPYAPFDLIHYEAYADIKDAKRREEYLKTNKGKTTLKTMLQNYFEAKQKDKDKQTQLQNIKDQFKMPVNAILCPICKGGKETPSQSFYKYGKRYSGHMSICLTCKGNGWIIPTHHRDS